jgi:hypothetical protein
MPILMPAASRQSRNPRRDHKTYYAGILAQTAQTFNGFPGLLLSQWPLRVDDPVRWV